jgi:hypothetical protein
MTQASLQSTRLTCWPGSSGSSTSSPLSLRNLEWTSNSRMSACDRQDSLTCCLQLNWHKHRSGSMAAGVSSHRTLRGREFTVSCGGNCILLNPAVCHVGHIPPRDVTRQGSCGRRGSNRGNRHRFHLQVLPRGVHRAALPSGNRLPSTAQQSRHQHPAMQ